MFVNRSFVCVFVCLFLCEVLQTGNKIISTDVNTLVLTPIGDVTSSSYITSAEVCAPGSHVEYDYPACQHITKCPKIS